MRESHGRSIRCLGSALHFASSWGFLWDYELFGWGSRGYDDLCLEKMNGSTQTMGVGRKGRGAVMIMNGTRFCWGAYET